MPAQGGHNLGSDLCLRFFLFLLFKKKSYLQDRKDNQQLIFVQLDLCQCRSSDFNAFDYYFSILK